MIEIRRNVGCIRNEAGVFVPTCGTLMRRENDRYRTRAVLFAQLCCHVFGERRSIEIGSSHRRIDAALAEFALKRIRLPLREFVERRLAADLHVVRYYGLVPLRRDAPAREHAIEKRSNLFGAGRPTEAEQDDGTAHALNSCTASMSASTLSTGVSGRIPCPRLKMCPGLPPARRRMSDAAARIVRRSENNSAGSRLPCTPTPLPRRCHASSSSTRQSKPMTSPPASRIASSNVPVIVPK